MHVHSVVCRCTYNCVAAGMFLLLQVNDIVTVIPRNSVIEANQSGLIAEPLIDITPQLPLPTYTYVLAEGRGREGEGRNDSQGLRLHLAVEREGWLAGQGGKTKGWGCLCCKMLRLLPCTFRPSLCVYVRASESSPLTLTTHTPTLQCVAPGACWM